jgi:2-methylcitrate dehydratase
MAQFPVPANDWLYRMDDTAARLVNFSSGVRYEDLSPDVVHETRRRLIDSFACVMGGWHEPVCEVARSVCSPQGAPDSVGVWGTRMRTNPEAAAFANGTMVRVLDLSDMYRVKSGGHPSDVIAAVLSVADMVGAGGARTIEAIVVAYEVYCTFCETIDVNTIGWDQPVFSVMASAIGAGKVLGLDADRLGHAISLAIVPNMALAQTRTGELSNWKGAAAANAARNGVFAALLARAGMQGPSAPFEGAGGMWDAVGRFDWQIGHGTPRIAGTHIKRFPVCYHGQSAIDAALGLRDRVRLGDIRRIRVDTYAQAKKYMGTEPSRWAPRTRETADHSLPYVVAVALRDGDVDASSFGDADLSDPRLLALMRVTEVAEDGEFSARYPVSSSSRLTVTLASGENLVSEARSPCGHSDNPMPDRVLAAKFLSLADGFCDRDAAGNLLDALRRFDTIDNVRTVLSLMEARAR